MRESLLLRRPGALRFRPQRSGFALGLRPRFGRRRQGPLLGWSVRSVPNFMFASKPALCGVVSGAWDGLQRDVGSKAHHDPADCFVSVVTERVVLSSGIDVAKGSLQGIVE